MQNKTIWYALTPKDGWFRKTITFSEGHDYVPHSTDDPMNLPLMLNQLHQRGYTLKASSVPAYLAVVQNTLMDEVRQLSQGIEDKVR